MCPCAVALTGVHTWHAHGIAMFGFELLWFAEITTLIVRLMLLHSPLCFMATQKYPQAIQYNPVSLQAIWDTDSRSLTEAVEHVLNWSVGSKEMEPSNISACFQTFQDNAFVTICMVLMLNLHREWTNALMPLLIGRGWIQELDKITWMRFNSSATEMVEIINLEANTS